MTGKPSLLHSTIKKFFSILNYSKASWGLFVLVQVGRIFTAISNSPDGSSRQLSTRCSVHAGRNLPGKGLRYLRTVRVTADVYRSLYQELTHRLAPMGSLPALDLPILVRFQPLYVPYGVCMTCVLVKQSVDRHFCILTLLAK